MESSFAHLERRAGAEWQKVRQLTNTWFSHLPATDRHDLGQRLRSKNDNTFQAAFLELYVHELLLNTGHRVDIHPELPCTKTRPDFLATQGSVSTIVECTLVTEVSKEEQSAQARVNALRDTINAIESPDFFVDIDDSGKPNTSVPLKTWSNRIRSWLASLNYDDILLLAQEGRIEELPSLQLQHDGLSVVMTPHPKAPSKRQTSSGRLIGCEGGEAAWVTSRHEIRQGIKKKAGRYGKQEKPYIVVVNCLGEVSDLEEIEAAIYGEDGLWRTVKQPSLTRLSAVIAIHHLLPWSITRTPIRLFQNPHAAHAYTGSLTELPRAELSDNGIRKFRGSHPRIRFGLEASWPRD